MSKEQKDNFVFLDISGTVFKTQKSILKTIPNSRLANLDISKDVNTLKHDSYYFNRDADSFKHILNAYREGELHISKDLCPQQFLKELEYWKIPIKLLAPCCWKTIYAVEDDLGVTEALLAREKCFNGNKIKAYDQDQPVAQNEQFTTRKEKFFDVHLSRKDKNTKEPSKLWLFLEEPNSSHAAKVVYKI